MANEVMLMLVGLGALLLLGGGKGKPTVQEKITGSRSGLPGMFPPEGSPAFDIAGYVDSLFAETATVPKQQPMQYFFNPTKVVTSSGVPTKSQTAPDLITPTTKVAIGGDGGETIVASSLAVIRTEQIKAQNFAAAANVQLPKTDTRTRNRVEEMRQRVIAQQLVSAARAAQDIKRLKGLDRSREVQEAANKVRNEFYPPTINYDAADEEGLSFGSTAGQSITVSADTEFIDVDFTPEYSESFVISGGMDSPTVYFSEDEQPVGVAVHEITAQYDIGF